MCKIHHAGDGALVVEFGNEIDRALNARALDLSTRLDELALAGIVETVPTFRSVTIYYDPLVLRADSLRAIVEGLVEDVRPVSVSRRVWRIPVCYDARLGQDLEVLPNRLGMSLDQLIGLHTQQVYSVFMLGFLPGQPYLGELPKELRLPRRDSPRMRIPAGSVGIATSLTCIFPLETPCGWHLIGRTPVNLWPGDTDPGSLLAPGDKVIFEPISFESFESLSQGLLTLSRLASSATDLAA
jgi:KipI family sensor histidine kinase inhibitor